jgi:hypothetical protein
MVLVVMAVLVVVVLMVVMAGLTFNINFSHCSVSEKIYIASRLCHFKTVRFMPHTVFMLISADT